MRWVRSTIDPKAIWHLWKSTNEPDSYFVACGRRISKPRAEVATNLLQEAYFPEGETCERCRSRANAILARSARKREAERRSNASTSGSSSDSVSEVPRGETQTQKETVQTMPTSQAAVGKPEESGARRKVSGAFVTGANHRARGDGYFFGCPYGPSTQERRDWQEGWTWMDKKMTEIWEEVDFD